MPETIDLQTVVKSFGISADAIEAFGTGLINHTWKVRSGTDSYILQKINQSVFSEPLKIAANVSAIDHFLSARHPAYLFVSPVKTSEGESVVNTTYGAFRMFPFVPGSHSKDTVQSPRQAKEAAIQFARFTRLLSDFKASDLHITIPSFHDLSLRFRQFKNSLNAGNSKRIAESATLVDRLLKQETIVQAFDEIRSGSKIAVRVTHHDTKISNVLFDEQENGLCVIDLDTVMPGYFISDLGDMMRTYLPAFGEEETDVQKIRVRPEFYQAIVDGFYQEMGEILSPEEKNYVFYSGEFVIYMQALRFLTDHINDDIYYGAKYPGHNYNRALNQTALLEDYQSKRAMLNNR